MARGPKKHLKRLAAPSLWMLDKLSGVYAPKPSTGPHKLRECIPLIVILRDILKYALTYDEAVKITMQRLIKVNGKVRTDHRFPIGYMDVIQIDQSGENFRIFYDTKGRFNLHRIRDEEATYKLCRVKNTMTESKKVPRAITSDGRTIRYIHPDVKVHDTVRIDLKDGKVLDFIKFEIGAMVMVTGGRNIGRIGTLVHREKYPGCFDIVHIKDSRGTQFATRLSNVFVIGQNNKPWVSLPASGGIKLSAIEDRAKRLALHCE